MVHKPTGASPWQRVSFDKGNVLQDSEEGRLHWGWGMCPQVQAGPAACAV